MADSERILKILLQIQSDLSGISPLKSGLEDVRKSAFSLGDAFKFAGAEEALRRVLDVVKEIPTMFVEGLKAGVEFNSQMQQLQVGLAGILRFTQPETFKSFGDAMQAAGADVDLLKQKANELGRTYEDFTEGFAHAQLSMSAVTPNIQEQINLYTMLDRVMQSMQITGGRAARDIADLFRGMAQNTQAGNQLAAALHMTVQEFDRQIQEANAAGKAMEFWQRTLSAFAAATIAGANTFQAQINGMHNALLDLESEAAKPLMAPLQAAIEQFSGTEKAEEIRAMARSVGDLTAVYIGMAAAIVRATAELGNLIEKHRSLASVLSLLPGGGFISTAAQSQSLNLQALQLEGLQKQYQSLRQLTLEAHSREEQEKAVAEIGKTIADIQSRILNGEYQNTEEAKKWLENIRGILTIFQLIAGTAEKTAQQIHASEQAAQALAQADDRIRVAMAEASDDKPALVMARAQLAADELKKSLLAAHVPLDQAAAKADELKKALIAAGNAQLSMKESAKDFTAALREDEILLQSIRQHQELINANPFLSPDKKAGLGLSSMMTELHALEGELTKLQSMKPMDPAQIEQVNQKLQQTQFEIDLLKLKIAGLSAPLSADLMKWASSFGTSVQQVSNMITGTLNTAISGTASALTGLITGTKNWQQAFAQAATSIIEQIIRIALQFIVSRLLMAALNRAAGATDAAAATTGAASASAAWAPAAVSASIATYGTAAGTGLAAYLSALATGVAAGTVTSGVGAAFGFAAEGGLIPGPQMTMIGEQGPEFIFSSPAVRAIGAENLQAAHEGAKRVAATGGAASIAGAGRTGSTQHHFVGVYFDKRLLYEQMKDREGIRTIIDIFRSNMIQV